MAVYKPTYCYPFLNTIDIRLGITQDNNLPCEFLKCKVDSSNINITGYKIRLLDGNNNQIFPIANNGEGYISSVDGLSGESGSAIVPFDRQGINSGLNGTYLQIPFFQNYNHPIYFKHPKNEQSAAAYSSHNAIYYRGDYVVDYVIGFDSEDRQSGDDAANPNNWVVSPTDNNILYYKPSVESETPFDNFQINGDTPILGQTILYIGPISNEETSETPNNEYNGVYRLGKTTYEDKIIVTLTKVFNLFHAVGKWSIINTSTSITPKEGVLWNDLRVEQTIGLDTGLGQLQQWTSGAWAPVPVEDFFQVTDNVFTPDRRWNPPSGAIWANKNNLSENNDAFRWQYKKYSSGYEYITVLKGYMHNTIFKSSGSNMVKDSTIVMWVDSEGNDLPGIASDLRSYKWEITLYQGNYEPGHESNYRSIQYTNINPQYLDMVLTSGTILGSRPSRIQIASSNEDNAILPGNNKDTLVLQTRYMQLYNFAPTDNNPENLSNIGNRFYVSSYDSAYGHVYPLEGSIDGNILSNITSPGNGRCQFFKHSNDPTAILDGEIVDYCIDIDNKNIVFKGWEDQSVTSARLVPVNPNDATSPDVTLSTYGLGYTVKTGDRVLLINQTNPEQNGVYRVNIEKTGSGSAVTDYTGWSRDASYDSWGKYLGAIIYDRYTHKNYESLANSGGTLWNPKAQGSGDSYLFFSEEKPIILFNDKIKTVVTFLGTLKEPTIDSIKVQTGNRLLINENGQWKIYTATVNESITPSTVDWTEDQSAKITNTDYIQITDGRVYGHNIVQNGVVTDALSTACVLQNTVNYTYISPYISITKNMYLKIIGHNIDYANKTPSAWLKINDIDTKIWRIKHDTLSQPLLSYSNEDNNIPYKYEVRSYFKVSDENPVYFYETPYLTIEINGKNGELLTGTTYGPLLTAEQLDTYAVLEGGEIYNPFYTIIYLSKANVNGRAVRLTAHYTQFESISWENYRWVLLDSNGNILQDTGKRYDKNMEVIFYGLSNDHVNSNNNYYSVIYVEDNAGNILRYTLKLVITPPQNTGDNLVPFTACFDQATHSVKLNYQDYYLTLPTVKDSEKAFINDQSELFRQDKSIIYETDKILDNDVSYMKITHYQADTGVPIYFGNLGEDYQSSYNTSLGLANFKGINYQYGFVRNEYTIDPNYVLTLSGDDNGQLYYQTEIELNDNYCGQIFDLSIDKSENSPTKLHLITFLPDNFSDDVNNELNSLRNQIGLFVDTTEADNITIDFDRAQYSNDLNLFNINTEDAVPYYYLQPSTATVNIEKGEFLHYNLSDFDSSDEIIKNKNLYILGQNDSKFNSEILNGQTFSNINIYNSATKFFGNLNLICENDVPDNYFILNNNNKNISNISTNAPSYWMENNKYIIMDSNQYMGQNNNDNIFLNYEVTDTDGNIWPSSNEENYYWNENSETITPNLNAPSIKKFLLNSNKDETSVVQMIPYARHNGLHNKTISFIVKLYDVRQICNLLDAGTCDIVYENNKFIISDASNNKELGVCIIQINI